MKPRTWNSNPGRGPAAALITNCWSRCQRAAVWFNYCHPRLNFHRQWTANCAAATAVTQHCIRIRIRPL